MRNAVDSLEKNGRDPYYLMSWLTQLLSYVEEQSVWENAQEHYKASPNPLRPTPYSGLSMRVPISMCPSDPRADQLQSVRRELYFVALTSYLGVSGKDLYSEDGILYRDSTTHYPDIGDGTSNTLLVGERPASTDYQFGWWYAGAGQRFTGSADMVLGVRERNVLPAGMVNCPPGPYSFGPGNLNNQCDMFHFWSLHSGGGNFLFADMHVQFLPYQGAHLLPALASRNQGDVADLGDF